VEEGVDGALADKYSPASARPRIFDGVAEAQLIALACGEPPKGRARWTLQLLEEQVVELKIVERASDNQPGIGLKIRLLSRRLLVSAIVDASNAGRPPWTWRNLTTG
jgi:hypothetical protein